MNKLIFILGAGGHAKVLLESLRQTPGIEIGGFLEVDNQLVGTSLLGIPIYNEEMILRNYKSETIALVNGIGSIDIPHLRAQQFITLKKMNCHFFSVIHPSCYYSADVVLSEGVQLLARSTILTGTQIGCNTIINTSASVDHDCKIGNHVHIAPGAVLSGGVEIADYCHIGVGAKIIQGIQIGKNSLIAAGAVVISDLPENSRVGGVPAKAM